MCFYANLCSWSLGSKPTLLFSALWCYDWDLHSAFPRLPLGSTNLRHFKDWKVARKKDFIFVYNSFQHLSSCRKYLQFQPPALSISREILPPELPATTSFIHCSGSELRCEGYPSEVQPQLCRVPLSGRSNSPSFEFLSPGNFGTSYLLYPQP